MSRPLIKSERGIILQFSDHVHRWDWPVSLDEIWSNPLVYQVRTWLLLNTWDTGSRKAAAGTLWSSDHWVSISQGNLRPLFTPPPLYNSIFQSQLRNRRRSLLDPNPPSPGSNKKKKKSPCFFLFFCVNRIPFFRSVFGNLNDWWLVACYYPDLERLDCPSDQRNKIKDSAANNLTMCRSRGQNTIWESSNPLSVFAKGESFLTRDWNQLLSMEKKQGRLRACCKRN